MDPFSWAMLIMTALSTVNSMTSGSEQNTENTPTPTGGPDLGEKPNAIGGQPAIPGIEEILAMIPDMSGATAAAGQAAQQTQAATPQAVSVFNTPDQNAAIEGAPPAGETPPAAPTPGVGEVLMAVPGALAATGNLLGLNDTQERTQRPAPAAGGAPGRPVGQFARPMGQSGVDIGQLLAALPGIRG